MNVWVLEDVTQGRPPRYAMRGHANPALAELTRDVHEAIQFPSKTAALEAMSAMRFPQGTTIQPTEHWLDPEIGEKS